MSVLVYDKSGNPLLRDNIENEGNHCIKTSRQEGESCRGVGQGAGLVEADAGDIGFFDDGRVVRLVFGEGESEVLDAVGRAEFSEKHDEFA